MGTDTSVAKEFADNNPTLCAFSWFTALFPKHKVSKKYFKSNSTKKGWRNFYNDLPNSIG